MDPVAKAQKTDALRRSMPFASVSALEAFAMYAKHNDIREIAGSRRSIARSTETIIHDTAHGPMILTAELVAKPPHVNSTLYMLNVHAYLEVAHKSPGAFHAMFMAMHGACPSSYEKPWRLIIYGDEVVPGNKLSNLNRRKAWILYFSFIEFGVHLHNEDAWCPLAAEPSHALKHIQAGVSQLFACVIKSIFGSHGHDLSAGITLVGPDGERVRFFAKLDMMVQDGGAHKFVNSIKGDTGIRMCMLCTNLVSKPSLVPFDASASLRCTVVHEEDLVLATDAGIYGSIDRLVAHQRTDTAGTFKIREKACGFNFQPHGMLFDRSLRNVVRPASIYCHDWMHMIFSSGIFNVVAFHFFEAIHTHLPLMQVWAVFHKYIMQWRWPLSWKYDPKRSEPFSSDHLKAYRKTGHIKCAASEGLALLPVIVFWNVATVLPHATGACKWACLAMVALGDIVDALQASGLRLTSPDDMRILIRTFMDACVAAGWEEFMIPKFHWLLHFPRNMIRWGTAVSCFVHERKHKLVLRYAENFFLPDKSKSKSVLKELIAHQLFNVRLAGAFDVGVALLRPVKASKKLAAYVRACMPYALDANIQTSTKMRTRLHSQCRKGDLALIRMGADTYAVGEIVYLIAIEGAGTHVLAYMFA